MSAAPVAGDSQETRVAWGWSVALRRALERAALIWVVTLVVLGSHEGMYLLGFGLVVFGASVVQVAALNASFPGVGRRTLAALLVFAIVAVGFVATDFETVYVKGLVSSRSLSQAFHAIENELVVLREDDDLFGNTGWVTLLTTGVLLGQFAAVATFARLSVRQGSAKLKPTSAGSRGEISGAGKLRRLTLRVVLECLGFHGALGVGLSIVLLVLGEPARVIRSQPFEPLSMFAFLAVVGGMGGLLALVASLLTDGADAYLARRIRK